MVLLRAFCNKHLCSLPPDKQYATLDNGYAVIIRVSESSKHKISKKYDFNAYFKFLGHVIHKFRGATYFIRMKSIEKAIIK